MKKNNFLIFLTIFSSFLFIDNTFANWDITWINEMKCDFSWKDDTISWCLSKYKSNNLVWVSSTGVTDEKNTRCKEWTSWDKCIKDTSDEENITYTLEWWFKTQVDALLKNVWLILWIIAVWAIVYAWLMLQFSGWNDEKIKKSKNIIKWALIWFAAMMSAWAIIVTVVDLMYWFF